MNDANKNVMRNYLQMRAKTFRHVLRLLQNLIVNIINEKFEFIT